MSPQSKRRISILGSTGSVGCSTLKLIAEQPELYSIVTLTAHQNIKLLIKQALDFQPECIVIGDASFYDTAKRELAGSNIEVTAGRAALLEAASMPVEWAMVAIVGAAGIEVTLACIRQGCYVALANKESLVSAGHLLLATTQETGATILPVDSEHNAIFQILNETNKEHIEGITLTASGGPFLTFDREELARVTPAQAVTHPNWRMGAKISVDSATMMNKGLELIEAQRLFSVKPEQLDVLIHPQSVVHGMVKYVDGSILAQMGVPDMRIPIAHTLAWPRRMKTSTGRLDLTQADSLTFEPVDYERFPALKLAQDCLQMGGGTTTVLNAANEVAVQAFLEGRINFIAIAKLVGDALEQMDKMNSPMIREMPSTLEQVMSLDTEARRLVEELINNNQTIKKLITKVEAKSKY
ncbi:MAG: 1-deoxy-D-xylulose-5-phosphate reductoisomerase [Parvularculales bacterium]